MTVHASTIWEIRTTGLAANGGGFANVTPGTSVDYSQQNAAQLSLIDIATDAAGTKLTSATGGFTAAMEGNCLFLLGGGATAGWYQIVTGGYINGNNVTIDRSAGANKVGVAGNLGGAFCFGSIYDNTFLNLGGAPGNIYYIKSGSYVLGAASATRMGSATAVVRLLGYKVTRGDVPLGNDRPLLNLAATELSVASYNFLGHLRFTGTNSFMVDLESACCVVNCKAVNTSVASPCHAFRSSPGSVVFIGCEATTAGGGTSAAFLAGGGGIQWIGCFAHDSAYGFYSSGNNVAVACVVDTCPYGFYANASGLVTVLCTVYHCTNGIYLFDELYFTAIVNTIISACDNGIVCNGGGLTGEAIYTIHSNFFNVADFVSVLNWFGNILGDPGLQNPGANDFSIRDNDHNVYEQAADVGHYTPAIV